MIELFARHGDTYRVFVPGRASYTYVIHHPDDVKRVLVSNHRNYTKGLGLDRVKILLGKGIMTSEGELWKRQRYMMQPFFHRRLVTRFAELIAAVNERFMARWDALCARGELLNLTDELSELTLEIVLRSIFGTDLDRLTQQLGGNPFELVTKESGRNLQFAYKFRSLTRLVAEVIARRRSEPAEHFDFLAMLLAARDKDSGEPMPERELIDEVMTLIVAGHETTASGLNWTWYLLAQHPQVLARLHAELDAAPEYAAPSLAQMEALAYTQQVVNESLRLYPPGWLLSRRTIEADVLGGFPVPAKSQRAAAAVPVAPAPAVLARAGTLCPGAFCTRARSRASALCLHALCGRPAPLHRRDGRGVRDAHAPVQGGPPLPPELRARQAARTRGADQPAHPPPLVYATGTPVTPNVKTLTELMDANRGVARGITYLEGEHDTREVPFAELYERALGILYHLQRLGARRGDKLILFLNNNEQFIDVFWAAILGGIVPVPVALGISDEHRHKVLRIARRLGAPYLYTEKRALERLGAFATTVGETELFTKLAARTFLVDNLDDISRAGSVQKAGPSDTAFIQFSSGSTSEPKGVVLTHANLLANIARRDRGGALR